jgi:small-conductance mechanosensitive channel
MPMADFLFLSDFFGPYADIIWAVIVLALSFFVARAVNWALKHFVVKVASRTKTELDDMIITALRKPIVLGFLLFGIYYALTNVTQLAAYSQIINDYYVFVQVFFAAFVAARLVNTFLTWYARNVAVRTKSKVDDQFLPSIKKVVYLIVFLVAMLFLMDKLGIEVTTLVATLGIGGLAIALALQSTLSNFFAGAYTTLDRPIRVGDYVELDTGDKGYVVDIGWRSTKLRRLDNNIVVLPNAKIAESKIINYDLPEHEMALVIPCGVSYESDLEKVEKVTVDVAKNIMKNIANIPEEKFVPFIRYNEFGDSNINFSIILRVKNFVDQYLVKHELIKALKKRYDQEGIEISWPVRKLYMSQTKKVSHSKTRTQTVSRKSRKREAGEED